jgi:hypothetical protein
MAISDFYKSGSPTVTNPPSEKTNKIFAAVWLTFGVLTIIGPAIYRKSKMADFLEFFHKYNWEEVKQAYYQKQENYYQNLYENQYGQEGYDYKYQYEVQEGVYDINKCKWWQLNCFPYYINENGEPEPTEGWYPSWFSGWTVSEEERERMLEDGETSSALIFTYVWQILMFLVILAYGYKVIKENRVVTGVTIALIIFANMSFLAMWMLADGSVITDGAYVQNFDGFFGQFAVLMFITNAWYAIFGIVFSALFAYRSYKMHSPEEKVEEASESYKVLDGDSPPSTPPREDDPPLVV